MDENNVFLRAWLSETEAGQRVFWERVDRSRFLSERVVSGGLMRGKKRVTVYQWACSMDEPLSKRELQRVAQHHLDGTYSTQEIDFRG